MGGSKRRRGEERPGPAQDHEYYRMQQDSLRMRSSGPGVEDRRGLGAFHGWDVEPPGSSHDPYRMRARSPPPFPLPPMDPEAGSALMIYHWAHILFRGQDCISRLRRACVEILVDSNEGRNTYSAAKLGALCLELMPDAYLELKDRPGEGSPLAKALQDHPVFERDTSRPAVHYKCHVKQLQRLAHRAMDDMLEAKKRAEAMARRAPAPSRSQAPQGPSLQTPSVALFHTGGDAGEQYL
ncbi:hypothetical protein DUNSADRAFT_15735 [Dunaliella salina]|uniref:Uncharacterized protein n=1 Tax=Dunaliella salina TaxID=3046 RepID=A0ABQ7H9D0_DUNSA|nr:hypothetical protein DUNSADRAFT_15735 [Dunaliella salina]|eukprot:KAF5843440.1 hypothetical protein DUNSADRAFT_15735 [Dunaliella salina]